MIKTLYVCDRCKEESEDSQFISNIYAVRIHSNITVSKFDEIAICATCRQYLNIWLKTKPNAK